MSDDETTKQISFPDHGVSVDAGPFGLRPMRVGDVIRHTPEPDRRNWWQRHAPYWAGGKPAPLSLDGWVVAAISYEETYELREVE
jgi:hypothetical protein